MSYASKRKENRIRLSNQKRKLENANNRHKKRVIELIETLSVTFEFLSEYKDKLVSTDRMITKVNDELDDNSKSFPRRIKKEARRNLENNRRYINSHIFTSKRLVSEIEGEAHKSSEFNIISKEEAAQIKHVLSPVHESADDLSIESLLSTITDNRFKEDVISTLKKYAEKVKEHKYVLPEDIKKRYLGENIKLLEDEHKDSIKKAKDYFETLEGKVLKFASYQLDSKKEMDPNYKAFLENNAESASFSLKNMPKERIAASIDSLCSLSMLTENEAVYLKTILKKDVKDPNETDEDIDLRAMFLSEEFGIDIETSYRISKKTPNKTIDEIYSKLRNKVNKETAKGIISINPELFLYDDRESEKYFGRLDLLLEDCRKYGFGSNFCRHENLASLDSLKNTLEEINRLKRSPSIKENIGSSELDLLKTRLLESGYDPELTMVIIGRGFWYGGVHLAGNHKTAKNLVIKNIGNVAKREYVEKGIRWLARENVILKERGYSLNNHPNSVSDPVLRDALKYVLKKPSTGF